MFDNLIKILMNVGNFLKDYINPFLTPFFALLAYVNLTDEKLRNKLWGKIFIITTIVYFLITLALCIWKIKIKIQRNS